MRVAVIGSPGSGKSVFSRALAREVGLPLHHLDDHYWHAGWTRPAPEEWLCVHDELVSRRRWIIDGNYADTLPGRLAACDIAIFFDVAPASCLWGLGRRTLQIVSGQRQLLPRRIAEAPSKQPVTGDMRKLALMVLLFRRRVRPGMLQLLADLEAEDRVVVMRTRREAMRSLPLIARRVASHEAPVP